MTQKEKNKLSNKNALKYQKALNLFVSSTGIDIPNLILNEELTEGNTFAAKSSQMITKMLEGYIVEGDIDKKEIALGSLALVKEVEDKYLDSEPAKNIVNLILMIIMKKFGGGA